LPDGVSQTRESQPGYWPLPIQTVFQWAWVTTFNVRVPVGQGSAGSVKESRPQRLSAGGPLEIVVYGKCCRIGGTLTLDDLAETLEIGDWKMPAFKAACACAASQGWLIVRDDMLTLTTAGLAAA
jgi:hypothetical protein